MGASRAFVKASNNSFCERAGEQDSLSFEIVGALEHNDEIAEGQLAEELCENLHVVTQGS